jgi:hypothetical protein
MPSRGELIETKPHTLPLSLPILPFVLTLLLNSISTSLADSNPETSLALGFRSLLQQMEQSEKVEPGLFVQALRVAFPQFAQQGSNGTYMQQDAEECWTQLVSSLARKLPSGAIQRIFHGELQTELSCAEAPQEEKQVNVETFQKLSCHITDQISHLLFGLKKVRRFMDSTLFFPLFYSLLLLLTRLSFLCALVFGRNHRKEFANFEQGE